MPTVRYSFASKWKEELKRNYHPPRIFTYMNMLGQDCQKTDLTLSQVIAHDYRPTTLTSNQTCPSHPVSTNDVTWWRSSKESLPWTQLQSKQYWNSKTPRQSLFINITQALQDNRAKYQSSSKVHTLKMQCNPLAFQVKTQ